MFLGVLPGHWSVSQRNCIKPRKGMSRLDITPSVHIRFYHHLPFRVVNQGKQRDDNINNADGQLLYFGADIMHGYPLLVRLDIMC